MDSRIDITGTPSSNGTYSVGNNVYNASDIGTSQGEIKIGNLVAPYVLASRLWQCGEARIIA